MTTEEPSGPPTRSRNDPQALIDHSPMSRAQINGVVITGALSALDGFDILASAFVAPAVAREFQLDPGVLGLFLSSSLLGMLIGSFTLAGLADIRGRRPTIVAGILVMSLGMIASAFVRDITVLSLLRVFTGIGIGAVAAVVNPVSLELSNIRSRAFVLAVKSIGFPLGGVLGGWLASYLISAHSWSSVFLVGGLLGLVLLLWVLHGMPESLAFLLSRRDENTLAKVNRVLGRFGHAPLDSLPEVVRGPEPERSPFSEIFRAGQRGPTLLAGLVALLAFLAVFYFQSWQTVILTETGFSIPEAAFIAGISSLVGAANCIVFGYLARRHGGRIVSIYALFGLGLTVAVFGIAPTQLFLTAALALLVGAFVTAGTISLYFVGVDAFETRTLATGTGFVLGMGRLGSAIAPSLAGGLFSLGVGRGPVGVLMGAAAIVAAVILVRMRHRWPTAVTT